MRIDMPRVIVTRPRIVDSMSRKGRAIPLELLPKQIGMRRSVQEHGGFKRLNEHLALLRRYLEQQVGRPWDNVYSEISAVLRVDDIVQQHVRDHIRDFVTIHPRTHILTLYFSGGVTVAREVLWSQPLYVDPRDGILKRTINHPCEKRERRQAAGRSARKNLIDCVELTENREMRLISGIWYEVRLAPVPEPEFRAVPVVRRIALKPYTNCGPHLDVEIIERQLATPPVIDVVSGRSIPAGPRVDEAHERTVYRKDYPDRRYTIAKRQLSKAELRRYGLANAIV